MNYFILVVKLALFDFSRNKGRAFLTSLGILIGVMAVVLLMAFGLGLKRYIEQQFESLGTNLLFVMPGSKNTIFRGGMVGGIRFDKKDVAKIQRIKTIDVIAPAFVNPAIIIEANGKNEIVELIASTENANPIFNLELQKGNLIEKKNIDKRDKVLVLSSKLAKKFYESDDEALGKSVKVAKQNFKIIGIIKSKGSGGFGGSDMDSHIYVPFTSVYSLNPDKKFMAIYLKANDKEVIEETKQEIQNALLKRYDKDDFSVLEQGDILSTISSIFGIINTVLVGIAAISLFVGGIGIMNIMYVTVTERIKEIGIRRALGARRADILYQFLAVSLILSLVGGFLGLGLSVVIVFFIQSLFPAYIDLGSVLLALGVSSVIGIVFGVFPAKKAADLSPIDAIRHE